jgi:hypothetical protein
MAELNAKISEVKVENNGKCNKIQIITGPLGLPPYINDDSSNVYKNTKDKYKFGNPIFITDDQPIKGGKRKSSKKQRKHRKKTKKV